MYIITVSPQRRYMCRKSMGQRFPALQQNGSTRRYLGMKRCIQDKVCSALFHYKTNKILNYEYEPNQHLIKFDHIITTKIHVYIKLRRIKVAACTETSIVYSKALSLCEPAENLNVSFFEQFCLKYLQCAIHVPCIKEKSCTLPE